MAEYIEREKTVELLRSLGNREYRKEKGTIQDAIKMISSPEYTPAADVAPVVHGRWNPTQTPFMNECEDCSICGYRTVWGVNYKFCPNCGAKMDLEEEE